MKKDVRSIVPYAREIKPAPGSLVEKGRLNFGCFDRAIRVVNPLDAKRVFGFPLPRFIQNMRLKEWQAFQLGNDECFILAVIYNQKPACLVQFIFCDRKTGRMTKYEKMVPSWRASVPSSLGASRARYITQGFRLDFHNRLDRGRIFIDVAIDRRKAMPALYGHFEALHEEGEVRPLVVSLPFAENRGMYSHKCLMPMQGTLCIGERTIQFSRADSFAIVDDHKGYYPYVMRYDWVTGAGMSAKGLTGFNLTDNQVRDKERYNENCLWLGRKLYPLPPVAFSRPDGVNGEWIIRDRYGMVDLVFRPVAANTLKLNLIALKTDYYGPFGDFSGVIMPYPGKKIRVNGYWGMGEQKYLRG
ncbi:MAG: DUF2804 domain-containing protein [Spirochaetes bacterium]|nr:DUF2804 domain-containing protein [Spirochaetota bacterium]